MAQFVLEIGTEEMPARFLGNALRELSDRFAKALEMSCIRHEGIRILGTPRRLVVSIEQINPVQEREEKVVTGPPAQVGFDAEGKLTKAGAGFAKSQGVDPETVFVVDTPKGKYLALNKVMGGQDVQSLLPTLCTDIISTLSFPKKMRWASDGFSFGRPIRWIVALFDDQIIPLTIGGVVSGRVSHGHRVMCAGLLNIPHAKDYFEILTNMGGVILDPVKRSAFIRSEGDRIAAEVEGAVAWNDVLLEEVQNLVEYPVPLLGEFDSKFLALPREVLLTSMEKHQKSFGLMGRNGQVLPYFLTTLNLQPKDRNVVKKGWEKVLRARLEDARFFWESDLKVGLDTWMERLNKVVFLGPLGTMGDKTKRLERLCIFLGERLKPEVKDQLARSGRLAKADLVSEMVGEFAELQGVMGGIYAGKMGETEFVSQALYEHYLPTGVDSPTPASLGGAILALADKADTLVGCFGLNLIPTGANDSYALRRQVLGICRIILDHKFNINLEELFRYAWDGYSGVAWENSAEKTQELLLKFVEQRLKAFFQSEGFESRRVDAAILAGFIDVRSLFLRLQALERFSQRDDFEQAVLTFKRASNIIRKQGQEARAPLSGQVKQDQLLEPAEKALTDKIDEIRPRFEALWSTGDFDGLFALLNELRPSVDGFFDSTMVMCEDPELRLNRLNLLQSLVSILGRLADFGALQI